MLIGATYRHGADWSRLGYCIYVSDTCSTAAATWAIAFSTVGAFVAATTAAVFAAGVYDIEVKPRLGQDLCPNPTGHNFSDRVLIVGEHRNRMERKPPNFNEELYWGTRHEFTNLGRLPLIGVKICGAATFTKDEEPYHFPIELGNIPIDKSIHFDAYFSKNFGQPTVTWDAGSAIQDDGTTVAFHPVPTPAKGRFTINVKVVYAS